MYKSSINKALILQGLLFLIAAGCSWENEEDYYPAPDICDTTSVSFSMDVVPILETHCYSCHSNANGPDFGNGNRLEDYEDVVAYAPLIVGSINHEDGFQPMPRGMEKLDPCLIMTIEAWVNSGTPNN